MERRGSDWIRGDWFVTFSGHRFFIRDPRPESICAEDIAHALSQVCRFGGHTRYFYSVAQHCVCVSEIVPPELALHGLMHDAAEAYCGDVIRPIKRELGASYGEIEHAIEEAIRVRFGLAPLSSREHDEIKRADNIALVTERRDLISPHAFRWREDERGFTPWTEWPIDPLLPLDAERLFLAKFNELVEHASTPREGRA